jgi:hypothetical protein
MPKPANGNAQTPKRRLVADRVARWVVSAGGIGIIASVLGILVFIVLEVLPLTYPAKVGPSRRVAVPGAGAIGAVLADEHRSHVAALDDRGQVYVVRLDDGKVVYTADLLAAAAGPSPATSSSPHPPAPSPAPSLPTSPGEGEKSLQDFLFRVGAGLDGGLGARPALLDRETPWTS